MKTLKKLLVAVSAVLALATVGGCGDKGSGGSPNTAAPPSTVDGKTAAEWKAEADRLKTEAEKKQAAKLSREEGEKLAAEKKKAANEAFLSNVDEQVKTITLLKNGNDIAEAVEVGLKHVSTGEISLNRMDGDFLTEVLEKVAPESLGENISRPEWEVVKEGRAKIRQAVIKWFTDDLKRLDVVWAMIRSTLRQKYAPLNTLRGHEKLFKTAYTQKVYAPLYECMQWHETLIYPRGDKPASTPNKKDIEGCNKAFKSFGVNGVELGVKNGGDSADHANIAFDNAIWIVEFLKRREADGGEKFAQAFQRLAMDYIK